MILDCYEILKKIESQPAMWTGEATLKSINIYISGYYYALLENKIAQQPKVNEPFFDWVAKKLGYYESTAGWANMILAYCMGFKPDFINWEEVFATQVTEEQHIKSIKFFYELVDKFKNDLENQIDCSFFITSMPESRPADYHLGYLDGCVFLDFNNFDNDRICLKRISFDGYGCCELSAQVIPLDKGDSQIFKTLFKENLNDQSLLLTIVKKSIALNKQEIWKDALEEFELL
jgi:hypothetical protein